MPRARGEGTISKHPKGWAGAITLGYDGNGKRKRRWVYGKTQKEALQKLEALKKQQATGSLVEPHRMTIKEYLDKFLEAKKNSVKARTVEFYRQLSDWYVIPRLGNVKLQKLTPLQVQEALNNISQKVSADAAARSRQFLFTALRQAVKWGLVIRNPVEATEAIRVQRKQVQAWTSQEAALFLAHAREHRLYAVFYVALSCGLRRGEVLGLKWGDITPTGLHVRRSLTIVGNRPVFEEPKTKNGVRFVPFAPDVYQVLAEHRTRQEAEKAQAAMPWSSENLVFLSTVGTPINPHNFERAWYDLQDKANGFEVALAEALMQANTPKEKKQARQQVAEEFKSRRRKLHSLRHSFATWEIAMNGADPKTLAGKLGHARASFTLDVYAHQFAEARQAQPLSLTQVLPQLGGGKN